MLGLFWEFHQQSKINEAQRQARQSETSANESRRRIAELEDRVDQLAMITAAMWTLLRRDSGLTDEQLMQQVEAIDLSDGKLDGKVRRESRACPKCHRNVASRHVRCVYCGEPTPTRGAFDRVL
jgi:ribosomal protein S27AE